MLLAPSVSASLERPQGAQLSEGTPTVLALSQFPSFPAAVLGCWGNSCQFWSFCCCLLVSQQQGWFRNMTTGKLSSSPTSTGLVQLSPAQNSPNVLKWVEALIHPGLSFLFQSVFALPSLLAPQLSSWPSRWWAWVPLISKHPNARR